MEQCDGKSDRPGDGCHCRAIAWLGIPGPATGVLILPGHRFKACPIVFVMSVMEYDWLGRAV